MGQKVPLGGSGCEIEKTIEILHVLQRKINKRQCPSIIMISKTNGDFSTCQEIPWLQIIKQSNKEGMMNQ